MIVKYENFPDYKSILEVGSMNPEFFGHTTLLITFLYKELAELEPAGSRKRVALQCRLTWASKPSSSSAKLIHKETRLLSPQYTASGGL